MDKTLGLDRDKFEALPKENQTASKNINHVRLSYKDIVVLPTYVLDLEDISIYSYQKLVNISRENIEKSLGSQEDSLDQGSPILSPKGPHPIPLAKSVHLGFQSPNKSASY